MVEIRKLDPDFWVSGQLHPYDMEGLAKAGVVMVVNNRPDGEAPDQPADSDLQAAARAAGLNYRLLAFRSMDATPEQARALAEIVCETAGPVLAFCQSGTRSAVLWAGARVGLGERFEDVAVRASKAGYDLYKRRNVVQSLAGERSSVGQISLKKVRYRVVAAILLGLLAVVYLYFG